MNDLKEGVDEEPGPASESSDGGPQTGSADLSELSNRPLASDASAGPLDWSEAEAWWGGASPLLRARWLPKGSPRDESVYGFDYSEVDGGRSLLAAYTYDARHPRTHALREVIDAGGVVLRFNYVPPGSTPAWAHPIYTTKVVHVRGHPAKLFEARRSEGSNVDFRVVYWEELSQRESGAQVQYEIEVHPELYTEEDHLALIERLEVTH